MKNFIIVSSSLAGILLMGLLVREATAGQVPLTGTWAGTATCLGIVQGVDKDPTDFPVTIAISRIGKRDLHLDITLSTGGALTGDLNSPPPHRYQGKSNGRGSAGKISECGTTFGPGESFNGVVGSVHGITNKKHTPNPYLTGELLALDELDNSAVACLFNDLAQTSTADPSVGSCP
jgi:hypothetical protein